MEGSDPLFHPLLKQLLTTFQIRATQTSSNARVGKGKKSREFGPNGKHSSIRKVG